MASLPGVAQKQKRKDTKQKEKRAKIATDPDDLEQNIASLLAATDALDEVGDERADTLSVQRRVGDELEIRHDELEEAEFVDETEELAFNASIIRAQEERQVHRTRILRDETKARTTEVSGHQDDVREGCRDKGAGW